ncbi:PREDICTED: thioredoxin F1, chloroplastic-like [Tarenaya hassleriana]|uniref:thioredoxin F1, chloroplastic-like n=1 Tax=Tarenaya hassleriana TaxID=28532 RepID=UPI00053C8EB9|nr:PREDICTED: thioredoxin F1, chloroplastic-like [Tarenaya hassleriana]
MPLSLRLSPSPLAVARSQAPVDSGAGPVRHHRIPFSGAGTSGFHSSSVFVTGKRGGSSSAVRCSVETVDVSVGVVTEVNKDTFWPIVKAAGEKIVVLDMYTQWCGPCKVIAPKFKELSAKYEDVVFLKLDCNQENRPLAKELGIRVVPTFKILKDGKIEKEVTGAKYEDLVAAIEAARSS